MKHTVNQPKAEESGNNRTSSINVENIGHLTKNPRRNLTEEGNHKSKTPDPTEKRRNERNTTHHKKESKNTNNNILENIEAGRSCTNQINDKGSKIIHKESPPRTGKHDNEEEKQD